MDSRPRARSRREGPARPGGQDPSSLARRSSLDWSGGSRAGILFVVVGLLGLVNDLVPGSFGHGHLWWALLDASTAAAGAIAMLLPWDRWPQRTSLIMAVLALAVYVADATSGSIPPAASGIYLVVILGWVGNWHGPGWCLAMAPLVTTGYLLPYVLVGVTPSPGAVSAVAVVVPTAVAIGAVLGHKAELMRKAHDTMTRAAFTDELTGLGNLRHAQTLLASLADDDAVVILDLDHFKAVNDRFGHARGDLLLQELASYLRLALRDEDSIARIGGEEFLVVLRGPTDPASVVERLVSGWRSSSPLATLSAGAARHHAGDDVETTRARADAALYSAKQAGRDRSVVTSRPETARRAPRPSGSFALSQPSGR